MLANLAKRATRCSLSSPSTFAPQLSLGRHFATYQDQSKYTGLVGTKITGSMDYGFPPTKVDLAARFAGKSVVVVGLPGAFTPT